MRKPGKTFEKVCRERAESPAQYDGYTPADGNRLLVLSVKVENDSGETLPMCLTDFQLQWGEGDDGWAWGEEAFNDNMMPLIWDLEDKETAAYDMLFEVPAGITEFSLCYPEEYSDRNGNGKTGGFYSVSFTVE